MCTVLFKAATIWYPCDFSVKQCLPEFFYISKRKEHSVKRKIIEANIEIENLPKTPNVSQTVVNNKKATNHFTSVGDRLDFGPLKSGSY